jgi:hypothetical protein
MLHAAEADCQAWRTPTDVYVPPLVSALAQRCSAMLSDIHHYRTCCLTRTSPSSVWLTELCKFRYSQLQEWTPYEAHDDPADVFLS